MNWCFSLYHTETKNLVYFFQYTEKWLEIQPVTGDFVSSAAQRESLLAIYSELANQRAQKALFTFVAYTKIIHFFVLHFVYRLRRFSSLSSSLINAQKMKYFGSLLLEYTLKGRSNLGLSSPVVAQVLILRTACDHCASRHFFGTLWLVNDRRCAWGRKSLKNSAVRAA